MFVKLLCALGFLLAVACHGADAETPYGPEPGCEPLRKANELKVAATSYEGVGWTLRETGGYQRSTFKRVGDMDVVTLDGGLPRPYRVGVPDHRYLDGTPYQSECHVIGEMVLDGIPVVEFAYTRAVDGGTEMHVKQACKIWISRRSGRALKADCRNKGPGYIKRNVWLIRFPDEGGPINQTEPPLPTW